MEQNKPKTITDIMRPELPEITAILSLSNAKESNLQTLALAEINYLEQIAFNKPAILNCDPLSMILAVKNVLRKNLSLDPNAGLVYIKTRNVNVGTYENAKWKTVIEIQETANGLLSYNRQIGTIIDFTNPKIKEDANGKTIGVSMELLKPSYGAPRWELFEFNEGDFLRWRRASHKENKKGYKENKGMKVPNDETLNYANPNYTSWKEGMDPEFARAKCIRHSTKKLGSNPNEVPRTIKLPENSFKVIEPSIAQAEADDTDFTHHEEINTTINETASSKSEPSDGGFDANDL